MTFRILVTGSRDWADRDTMRTAIEQAIVDLCGTVDLHDGVTGCITLVHGNARGADLLADGIARDLGCMVEAHPADWGTHGRAAGPIRNAHMVALGADVALAFPLGESRGTRGCMTLAQAAGIPVHNHGDKEPT